MDEYNDIPIQKPVDDRFGFSHIAKSIAEAITGISEPEGSVISIYGAWGTGKSSMVNLIKHFINFEQKNSQMKIVDMNFWWFKGDEAIIIEFFRKLQSATGTSNELAMLGSQILGGFGSLVGPILNLAQPGTGIIASKIKDVIKKQIEQSNTVESLHEKISIELRRSNQKFLIVIDDIDRLSPDEALLVFRLVKTVGCLPNVIYLMAYDREIAEKAVSNRYPSEGSHYLEKIVQAGFDVPKIQQPDLVKILDDLLEDIWGYRAQPRNKRYKAIMNDVVLPKIISYRDVLRLKNMLEVTWKSVDGKVDRLDFLAIEIIRIKYPNLYNLLKSSKEYLSDSGVPLLTVHGKDIDRQEYCNTIFLGKLKGKERIYIRTILMHLFPVLALIWNKKTYSDEDTAQMKTEHRVFSSEHFDTYFRYLPELLDSKIYEE